MLQLPNQLEDSKANNIVKKFINDRLIAIMEEIILDEVSFTMAMEGSLDESSYTKSFEEMVNIIDLMTDIEFAENVSLQFLPDGFPLERANQVFLGLYMLLKAPEEYIPELLMEYALFSVIYSQVGEIDMINEDTEDGLFDDLLDDPFFEGIADEEYTTVLQIPEPDRSVVMDAVKKQYEEECEPEELDEMVEYVMNSYEDLREYGETCFWDEDFMLLNDMSEEKLLRSELNKYMGIAEPKNSNIIEFPVVGKDGKEKIYRAEIKIQPWNQQ